MPSQEPALKSPLATVHQLLEEEEAEEDDEEEEGDADDHAEDEDEDDDADDHAEEEEDDDEPQAVDQEELEDDPQPCEKGSCAGQLCLSAYGRLSQEDCQPLGALWSFLVGLSSQGRTAGLSGQCQQGTRPIR